LAMTAAAVLSLLILTAAAMLLLIFRVSYTYNPGRQEPRLASL
jgi:hypothetical protein